MFKVDMERSMAKICQCSDELGFSNVKKIVSQIQRFKFFGILGIYELKKDEETGDAKARLKRISSENNLQGVSKESEQQ